jgi:hypothetical protein
MNWKIIIAVIRAILKTLDDIFNGGGHKKDG